MKISSTSLLWLPLLLGVVSADDTFDQEEPTNPPTSQFQGPSSGFVQDIEEGSGPTINQDRVVDYEYCYQSLANNDLNGNLELSRDEFENFAQDFGSATECLAPLSELPLDLLSVWNQLSCECAARGGPSDCCLGSNANIPITGVGADDAIVIEEQQYLRQVCLRTDQAIITFCGPPVVPPIPPIPPAVFLSPGPPAAASKGLTIGLIFAGLFLLLPWRRRWIFCAATKDEDDEESDDESEDAGGARHLVTETGAPEDEPETEVPAVAAPDLEQGEQAEPADDAMQLRAAGEEEDGEFGGTSYGRTVEEPEYEEEGDPKKFVYEQYDLPEQPEDPINLKPIPVPVKEEEDEPYDLEHYVPDGGIVQYEREGEWRYDADGGWTPEERPDRAPTGWDHAPYEREVVEAPPIADNRRERVLEAYGAGEVFDRLEQDQSEHVSAHAGDMFDWVIQSTLNTLDQRGDDLQGSVHSGSSSSKDSGRVE
eukprot:Nitzschia sp. Nitz4//scaffold18_size181773//60917//62362//NITZ4_001911-RA/size181773-processed-gene-0.11-mRNA-1//1//CDS//3329539999//5374//frame0